MFGKGLFGKSRMSGAISGFGGGTFNMDGTQAGDITYTPQAQAIMQGQAPMPAPKPNGLKNALLAALGGAADGAATFFGGQPLIAQGRQFQQVQAARQAEQERQRSMDLADYRTKLGIQAEFQQPEAPKPGSFEWWSDPRRTPEEKATFAQYRDASTPEEPRMVTLPDGRAIFGTMTEIERVLGGGAGAASRPARPVGGLTPIGGGTGGNVGGSFLGY